ncbi:hypothetical protein Ae168Ps1_0306 [Pseudonocardia sp. Ae168_Ps1]|nr:hypothetical protein Ae150APs1_0311 [Pseudonocardia sp. Ae150A_Ps1]OLL77900.1 hypothetical protein Ae168Ps1_0306 [Pseudonocardia sp. Ae168_Ps1]OLL87977.1 hypothetical protein Ae263Ps1_5032c [Pseudonocardia sp. Ae263_Ps1]OLL91998.1 hypothetical protein Ae356Ps1_1895 [Pseudonocardia sp. Ae356_Ps1]
MPAGPVVSNPLTTPLIIARTASGTRFLQEETPT